MQSARRDTHVLERAEGQVAVCMAPEGSLKQWNLVFLRDFQFHGADALGFHRALPQFAPCGTLGPLGIPGGVFLCEPTNDSLSQFCSRFSNVCCPQTDSRQDMASVSVPGSSVGLRCRPEDVVPGVLP